MAKLKGAFFDTSVLIAGMIDLAAARITLCFSWMRSRKAGSSAR